MLFAAEECALYLETSLRKSAEDLPDGMHEDLPDLLRKSSLFYRCLLLQAGFFPHRTLPSSGFLMSAYLLPHCLAATDWRSLAAAARILLLLYLVRRWKTKPVCCSWLQTSTLGIQLKQSKMERLEQCQPTHIWICLRCMSTASSFFFCRRPRSSSTSTACDCFWDFVSSSSSSTNISSTTSAATASATSSLSPSS